MSVTSPELTSSRARREAAIRRTVVSSIVARVFTMGVSLAQIPLALAWLGSEAYGFWIALSSGVLLLNLADFGLGLGMQNRLANMLSRGQTDRAAPLFATSFASLAAIGAIIFLLGLPLARGIDWAAWFQISDSRLAAQAEAVATAALVAFCVGLPFTTAPRIAQASQEGWIAAIWNAVVTTVQLAVIWMARHWDLSLASFALIFGLVPALGNLAQLAHMARRLGWRRRDFSFAPAGEQRALFTAGIHFTLPQISAAFLYNAAPPVIAAVANPSAVAAFHFLQRIFGLLNQAQHLVLGPIWPAYSDAQARGDVTWIRRTYRRTQLGSLLGIGLPAVALALLLPFAPKVWPALATLELPLSLVWLVGAWNVLLCLGQPAASLLGGLGRVRRFAWFSLAGNVVSAGCMVALGAQWGSLGVVAGLLVGYVLIGLPGTLAEAFAATHSVHVPSSTTQS